MLGLILLLFRQVSGITLLASGMAPQHDCISMAYKVDSDSKSGATGTTTQPVKIGNVNIGSGEERFWDGQIDDVRINN